MSDARDLSTVEELNNLRNTMIQKILEFTTTILVAEDSIVQEILEELWTDNLFTLVFYYTLYPRKVGLTPKALQTFKVKDLEVWFNVILTKMPKPYLIKLQEFFLLKIKEDSIDFMNIDYVVSLKQTDDLLLSGFLRGLIILQKCQFLDLEKEKTIGCLEKSFSELILRIFINNDRFTRIDIYMEDYINKLMNYLFLDYQPQLVETAVHIITKSYATTGHVSLSQTQVYLLEELKIPVFRCMLRNSEKTLEQFNTILQKSPDKMFLLMEELLLFAERERTEHTEKFAYEVIAHFNDYQPYADSDRKRKSKFININRIALLCRSDLKEAIPKDLSSWIADEFNRSESFDKQMDLIYCFPTWLVEFEPSHLVQKLKNGDHGWLLKLSEGSKERYQAVQCLQILLKILSKLKLPIIYEIIIQYTAGACNILLKGSKRKPFTEYFSGISNENSSATLKLINKTFMSLKGSSEARLDVLQYFLLPSLESCNRSVLIEFYEQHIKAFSDLVCDDLNDVNNKKYRQSLVNRIAGYKLFELMYGLQIQSEFINSFLPDGKELLSSYLTKKARELGSLATSSDEDRELVRVLHCTSLNCLIAVVGCSENPNDYDMIFKEIVWERIVDCERTYDLEPTGFQKKRINLRRTLKEGRSLPCWRDNEGDPRQCLSLENDDLNEHECAASITGMIMHVFNSNVMRLPELANELDLINPPNWLIYFRQALLIDKDNVSLFLMRIIGNVKTVFVTVLKPLFKVVVKALCLFLSGNSLNYLVRDVLTIIIEARYELREDTETKLAQELVEHLIERARDSRQNVYEYNIELIQDIAKMWRHNLNIPKNLDAKIRMDSDLAVRLILILFRYDINRKNLVEKRELHALVRKKIFRWQEPDAERIYETLGWIMRCSEHKDRNKIMTLDLVDLFTDMQRYNSNYCARMIYLIFTGYPNVWKHEEIWTFINTKVITDNERKVECYEIYFEAVKNLAVNKIDLIELAELLELRALQCLDVVLRIIKELVPLISIKELLPLLELLKLYTGNTLLKHKMNVYDIFISAYEKYEQDASEGNGDAVSLIKLCTNILITGASDKFIEIQDKIIAFWKKFPWLPQNISDRIVHLLKMHSPEVDSSFAQFFCLLMLDLVSDTEEQNKILFDPLAECCFKDYQITVPTRRRRKKAWVPLFVRSLVKLFDGVISLQDNRLHSAELGKNSMELDLLERLMRPNTVTHNRIPNPSENKLSKRFSPEAGQNVNIAIQESSNVQTFADEYYQTLKKEQSERCETVNITRKYRNGDYPDVEITQADIITSFGNFTRCDQKFANDLAIAIASAVAKSLKNSQMRESYMAALADACQQIIRVPNEFAPTAMEILIRSNCLHFKDDDVTNTAISMGQQCLGILLLEQKELESQKRSSAMYSLQNPLHLASLYRSIGEQDVVNSIMNNWKLPSDWDCLEQAGIAEVENKWLSARIAYEEGYEAEDTTTKDHCLAGMFRCLGELCSWAEINKKTKTIFNEGDLNSIWQHSKKNELLPWMVTAQLQEMLANANMDRQYCCSLGRWINDKKFKFTRSLNHDLAVFYLSDSESFSMLASRNCLARSLSYARDCWIRSDGYLSENTKLQAIIKTKIIRDVLHYLEALEFPLVTDGVQDLVFYWSEISPRDGDDLHSWSKRITYRVAFAHQLLSKIENDLIQNSTYFLPTTLNQYLSITDLALKNRNTIIARKYSLRVEKALNDQAENEHLAELRHKFDLIAARYKLLCGKISDGSRKKFAYYASAWQLANNLAQNDSINFSMRLEANQQIFLVTTSMYDSIDRPIEWARLAVNNDFVRDCLKINAPEEFVDALLGYSFGLIRTSCQQGSNNQMVADSYMKLIEYMHGLMLERCDGKSNLQKDLIKAVLTAMKLGSLQAIAYFGCLLKPSIYINNEQAVQLFIEGCQNIPSWMFLYWLDELLSQIVTPFASFVLPIVRRMAEDYPNSIIYNIRTICDVHPELRMVTDIYDTLFAKPKTENFFKALEYLCQPEYYLQYQLRTLSQSTSNSQEFTKSIDCFLKKITANSDDDEPHVQGPLHDRIFTEYCKKIENLKISSDYSLKQFCTELQEAMQARLACDKITEFDQLEHYTPYLNNFESEELELEIPIRRFGKPLPRHRAKIARIKQSIDVVNFKRGTIKICLVGTDGRSYDFQVRFGEDARRERQMQRIFEVMNEAMLADDECRVRNLSVFTYEIIPCSKSLSLVQWIHGTKSLKEFVEFSIEDKESLQIIFGKYQTWIAKAADTKHLRTSCIYKQALVKYNAKDVIDKMNELLNCIDTSLLRKTFEKISHSLQCFIQLRQNFIKSYAVMCIAHWVTGVGSRTLEHTIIEKKTGRCIGIDFALVFDAGLNLPIPELVPFRLTHQIITLLKPWQEQDFLGTVMTKTLTAYKKNKNFILAHLDIFLRQHLNWNEKLNDMLKEDEENTEIKWCAKRNFNIVQKKLSGAKPTNTMLDVLKIENSDSGNGYHFWTIRKTIINGTDLYRTTMRSFIKHNDLSPKEQVECLLDQAKDLNVLGRLAADWYPFI